MEDMIFHLMKESDESVKAKWIELLHHVTFQDAKSLGRLHRECIPSITEEPSMWREHW